MLKPGSRTPPIHRVNFHDLAIDGANGQQKIFCQNQQLGYIYRSLTDHSQRLLAGLCRNDMAYCPFDHRGHVSQCYVCHSDNDLAKHGSSLYFSQFGLEATGPIGYLCHAGCWQRIFWPRLSTTVDGINSLCLPFCHARKRLASLAVSPSAGMAGCLRAQDRYRLLRRWGQFFYRWLLSAMDYPYPILVSCRSPTAGDFSLLDGYSQETVGQS